MSKIQIDLGELIKHLEEQNSFLESSLRNFSEDKFEEAKRIAHSIRLLLYNTSKSKALLTQIASISGIKFELFEKEPNSDNFTLQTALYFGCQIPPFSLDVSLIDFRQKFYREDKADAWWKRVIVVMHGQSWSRKDIILKMSNKDGGSHIDPLMDRDYANLREFGKLIKDNNGISEEVCSHLNVAVNEAGVALYHSITNYLVALKNKST